MSGPYLLHPNSHSKFDSNYITYNELPDDDDFELGGKSPNLTKKPIQKKSKVSVCTTILSLLVLLSILAVLIWSYIH
mgnify:CR=1 FL=1|tara:strand:+ start:4609 stop:4839 length:231 start_codon:yes stop_codon:yes gene_type:complete